MKFLYLICTIMEVTSKCLMNIEEETLVYTSIQSGFILKILYKMHAWIAVVTIF